MTNKISMSQFGHWGRAGNQFFQYSFLKTYAKRFDLELQLPPWVGNHLFGTDDPPITEELKPWVEPDKGLRYPVPPADDRLVNRDYRGYSQYHTSCLSHEREWVTSLFQPVPSVVDRLSAASRQLRTSGSTIIGVHLRRGDYGQSIFPIIPVIWYLDWLEENIGRFSAPALFVATEDGSLASEFNQYHSQTCETLGIDLSDEPMTDCTYLAHDLQTRDSRAMDWYPDFHLLSQCDVILAPNSTFSFFAGMLAPCLQEFWRASLATAQFEPVEVWNGVPLLRECVRDYPTLEGIALKSNAYW